MAEQIAIACKVNNRLLADKRTLFQLSSFMPGTKNARFAVTVRFSNTICRQHDTTTRQHQVDDAFLTGRTATRLRINTS